MVCRRSPAQRLLLKDEIKKPTLRFVHGYISCHDDRLNLSRAVGQEVKLFYSVNARSIYNHFGTIEKLFKDEGLTDKQIFNLNEVCATPDKYFDGHNQKKCFLPSHRPVDMKLMEWAYHYRITIISIVSASDECGPPLFIFMDKIPHRNVLRNGVFSVEFLSSNLPFNSPMDT